MNQEKPKVYTAEFRESSVKLATESDKPVAQTARDIGVNEKKGTLPFIISMRKAERHEQKNYFASL
jgi:hypothetical protein